MLTWLGTNTENPDGEAGTLILLHAFPLSACMWEKQIEALGQEGYRVVAPNAFGTGGSEERPSWDFTDYADELVLLMDSLGIGKATVAGLSMGGYQAFELWKRHPGRVASLVLADTRAEADTDEARATRLAFIAAIEEQGTGEAANRMVPNYFSRSGSASRPELADAARACILRQPVIAVTSAMEAIMRRADSMPILGTISCPTTIICGSEDHLTPPSLSRILADTIADARLEIIEGAGHLSNMEQPETFNAVLKKHLQALPR